MNRSHEHALALLERAEGDRYVAERLAADAAAPGWSVAFHAQQAVEKAIKAVLTARGIEYPRTHNLAMLLQMLKAHCLPEPPDADGLPRLTPFGAALRYEDTAAAEDVLVDRAWASECAERTVEWARTALGEAEERNQGSVS
jgi:HEPN domain-containing protein